ncbi:ATP synthase subunit alpha, related [Eimeria acervulina]|uniref:ATP synthase subunit alpha, related n=1 Tax=Eimeria acervulina TaxID=5801 RepID=U6GBG9_EIMAC|nr:ATP synthase subunit alpha, related [Eimeria acervulina]CDI77586.1 ATP synthase subunit alpha, related [Eimeria acervulina]
MKQVAGSMKLELAQFREVAAFAQFGSDLDASTRQLLVRGAALTEILKQKQNSPIAVPLQGYLDPLDPKEISRFESLFVKHIETNHQHLLDTIARENQLSEETEKSLRTAIEDFLAANEFKKR